MSLVLASSSPGRLATLRAAGIEPRVIPSDVDEDAALASAIEDAGGHLPLEEQVLVLARVKARDVASRLTEGALVLGGDSMLELGGVIMGKPHTPERARERWRQMRGSSGVLYTGHWLIDTGAPIERETSDERRATPSRSGTVQEWRGTPSRSGTVQGWRGTPSGIGAAGQWREVGGTSATRVHFADLSDDEIDAYIASGEPLRVAGAFTIDSLGGPFITKVEGDHHGVVGLSLPLLRELLLSVGIPIHRLWSTP